MDFVHIRAGKKIVDLLDHMHTKSASSPAHTNTDNRDMSPRHSNRRYALEVSTPMFENENTM